MHHYVNLKTIECTLCEHSIVMNKIFNREICVCAHLTQTRHAQKTCAEMREYMEKDIRQSLQEHIFRLENRRRELMRPEYFTAGADDRAGTAADF